MRKIGIVDPCTEDRSNMTPVEGGDFCRKCSKIVHDFSKMSPDEIKRKLIQLNERELCGRMTPSQESILTEEFERWKSSKQVHVRNAMVFSLFIVFGMTLFSCSSPESESQFRKSHAALVKSLKNLQPDESKEKEEIIQESTNDPKPFINKEKPPVCKEKTSISSTDTVVEIIKEFTYDGGMMLPEDYPDYLEDWNEGQKDDSGEDIKID